MCTIGLIPFVLGLSIKTIYKESKLSLGLFIYMVLIAIWQLDVGVLYFENILSEETILFLFKLLRLGPTFSIPVILYVAYTIQKDQPAMIKQNSWLARVSRILFSKKALIISSVWSALIYIINWTSLGIKGLTMESNTFVSSVYYFPEYGPLAWLYILHMSSFLLLIPLVLLISNKISNSNFKVFLRGVYIHTLWMVVPGYFNFFPASGAIASSIGVILFSTMIVHGFIKFNTNLKSNYYQLMERQKKLDYTGSLAGSLIHEVKNTNQIIKGFSNMLDKSKEMTERDRSTLEMVQKSSKHLDELTDNFKGYMNSSNLYLQKENLETIINESIEFSTELLRKNHVEVEFSNEYNHLNVYANRTNLKQVFINLIKNSVEATNQNDVVEEMYENKNERKISIRTEIDDNMINIHFIDTGKGIPPGNWESVFDPFISMSTRGMGYGLPFVKKTIIEHLGNIKIANSTPEGTHFRIEIPQNGILDTY